MEGVENSYGLNPFIDTTKYFVVKVSFCFECHIDDDLLWILRSYVGI